MEHIRMLQSQFKDTLEVYTIYITEAHPSDGWYMEGESVTTKSSICYQQPKTLKQRRDIVQDFVEDLGYDGMNLLIDDMENTACKLYTALPERLFIVLNGRVVYRGGRGPYGYNVQEVENWILNHQKMEKTKCD